MSPSHLRRYVITACLCAGCAADRVSPNEDARAGAPSRDVSPADIGVTDVASQQDASDAGLDESFTPIDVPVTDAAACRAERDGVITRAELPYVLGAGVIYQVNRAGSVVSPVDTVGASSASGRVWDFSALRSEDHRVLDEVMAPTGQWWSASVPTASFAAWIDRDSDILGVYRATGDALELLATVSAEMNRTRLLFDPPVDVLRLPLMEGSGWTQSVTGRGMVNFFPLVNVTNYTFRVDARGQARTPAGSFAVLRVRVELDQVIPGTLSRRTQRSYVFVTECFGVVARISSVDNEATGEFTRASEYRRLGL